MAEKPQGCTKRRYEVTHQDLPVCCPMPEDRVWDAHPRVYFPLEEMGHFTCPYCDAEYILIDYQPPIEA